MDKPAFPSSKSDADGPYQYADGMTLREFYAGMAPNPPDSWIATRKMVRTDAELAAAWAFEYADAMIAEGEK